MKSKFNRKAGVLVIVFAMLMAMTTPLAHAATAYGYHPEVKAYGTVAKDVYADRSMFDYVDDDGLTSTLPFDRQDGTNVSIPIESIVFEDAIVNKTIAKAEETISHATKVATTLEYLTVDDKPYIYYKLANITAITNTQYYSYETLEVNPNQVITNDYSIFLTFKHLFTGDNVNTANTHGVVVFRFLDEGGASKTIGISHRSEAADSTVWANTATGITIYIGGKTGYYTFQNTIQEILDHESKSWTLVKFEGITLSNYFQTTAATDDDFTSEVWIRNAFVSKNAVKLKDETTADIQVNGTSINHVYDEGDTIEFSGKDIELIKGLSIPFEAADSSYELEYVDGIEGFSYEHTLNLPSTEEAEADTLTYSSTNLTLRSWWDGSYFTGLSSRGSDKLDDVTNKDVVTTSTTLMADRAWSYALESSLTEDTDYTVKFRAGNLPDDVTDSLAEYPTSAGAYSSTSGFLNYISYKFWAFMSVIASALGVGVQYTNTKKKGTRRAVRVIDLLMPAFPMTMPMAQMPIMRSGKDRISGEGSEVSPIVFWFSILMFAATIGLFFYGYFFPASMIGLMPQLYVIAPAALGYFAVMVDAGQKK